MPRINFVEADEVLLPVLKIKSDQHVISETRFFGRQYRDASYVIHEFDDDVAQVLRFSRTAMSAEDVTEEVAAEYLKDYDAREGVTLEDEKLFPAYVQRSTAWALWKDDLEAERPIGADPDRARIDYRERQYDATYQEAAE